MFGCTSLEVHGVNLFQSFKRKPGQADNERSMGDHNEHIHKRLRTIESSSEAKQNTTQPKQNVAEADAFEHIKQGSESYDAQTYGMLIFLGVKSCYFGVKS